MVSIKKTGGFVFIALAIAAGAWAFWCWNSERFHGGDSESPFNVTRVELERDHQFAVLTLTVDYDNRDSDKPVKTAALPDDPDGARLITAGGRAPELFFLAGNPPPVVEPGKRSTIEVLYWVESADLKGALYFESRGKRTTLKAEKPFVLETIENGKKVVFTEPDWSK